MIKIINITILIYFSFLNYALSDENSVTKFISRETNECLNCDLSGMNFKHTDLTNANLSGSLLINTNFHRANLRGANFSDAKLFGVNLNKTDLIKANFNNATITETMMYESNLSKSSFQNTLL